MERHRPPLSPQQQARREAIIALLATRDSERIAQAIELLRSLDDEVLLNDLGWECGINESGHVRLSPELYAALGGYGHSALERAVLFAVPRLRAEATVLAWHGAGTGLPDLHRLPGLTALRVVLQHELSDLRALRGHPTLHTLELHAPEHLKDLTPLVDIPHLRHLRLTAHTDADLSVLSALRGLETLYFRTHQQDLSVLRGLDALEELHIHVDVLSSLEGLSGLPRLRRLEVSTANTLTRLRGLGGLPALTELVIRGERSLTDLGGMEGVPSLASVALPDCLGLVDLGPLASLPRLTVLSLKGCMKAQDLRPLSSIVTLEELSLRDCFLHTDLSPLSALTGLRKLTLTGCRALQDLRPLLLIPSLQVIAGEPLRSTWTALQKKRKPVRRRR